MAIRTNPLTNRWLLELAVPCRIRGDESWSDAAKESYSTKLNSTAIRFVPALLVLRGRALSRVELNALGASLTSPLPAGKSALILDGQRRRCYRKDCSQL